MALTIFEEAVNRGEFLPMPNYKEIIDMMFASGRGMMMMMMSVILDGGKELPRRLRVFVDLQLLAIERKH
jgi:hypothetical protein